MRLTVILEPAEGGWFVAHCPELGTASQGASQEAAITNLRQATELYLETVTDDFEREAGEDVDRRTFATLEYA